MERPGGNILRITKSEGQFLCYVVGRINHEVGRFQQGEQGEALTRAHIKLLADRALEILGTRQELEAWLEAATRATELPWASSAAK